MNVSSIVTNLGADLLRISYEFSRTKAAGRSLEMVVSDMTPKAEG